MLFDPEEVTADPVGYTEIEDERDRFIAAVKEGLNDIDEGRTRPLEVVYAEMNAKNAKYGF